MKSVIMNNVLTALNNKYVVADAVKLHLLHMSCYLLLTLFFIHTTFIGLLIF